MDWEKVIEGLECCIKYPNEYGDCLGGDCLYGPRIECCKELMRDALALLKVQEPRLVTEADFKNADDYGYLPVWVEERDDSEIICDCITTIAITSPDDDSHCRYWTSRPDEKRRAETPWH